MILKKSLYLLLCFVFLTVLGFGEADAQGRARIVKQTSSQPINQPQTPANKAQTTVSSKPTTQRPVLTNNIQVVVPTQNQSSLVKKTVLSSATNVAAVNTTMNARLMYSAVFSSNLLTAIKGKLGIPYRYGSEGPNSYDCSSFVWTVFQQAGIPFERSSARNYWAKFEPVSGDERYRFGTLVFFNRLGHVGIVADENGFYHASSSKGITYSSFKGYWEKRIVGFRRIPLNVNF